MEGEAVKSPSEDERKDPATLRTLGVSQSFWWRAVLPGALALAFGLALLGVIYLFARPLALLALGITIAEALAPLVGRLARWMPRGLAIVLIYLVFILALVGIVFVLVPPLIEQARSASEYIPTITEWVQEQADRFDAVSGEQIFGAISSQLGTVGGFLVGLPAVFFGAGVDLFLVIFISIYWIMETPTMLRFFLSFFPPREHARVGGVLHSMGQAMGGFVRGTVIDAAAVAVFTYLGLLVIGLDYALVLAIFAGLMEVIPVMGPIIAAVPMILVALLDSVTTALIVLAFVLVLQQAESRILLPNIMRSQTEASPLLTLLAIFVGGTFGGLVGALVAIPLAAALRVLVVQVVAPAIRRRTGVPEQEIGPKPMDAGHEEGDE
ncbi:MAG: AI-2E family transporter [Anaerolineae bacterium]